jgi:hypothetical protein
MTLTGSYRLYTSGKIVSHLFIAVEQQISPCMRLTTLPESALLFFSLSFFSVLPSFFNASGFSSLSTRTPEASFLRRALS